MKYGYRILTNKFYFIGNVVEKNEINFQVNESLKTFYFLRHEDFSKVTTNKSIIQHIPKVTGLFLN